MRRELLAVSRFLQGIRSSDLEMSQRADGFIEHDPAMVEDFLKLCRRFAALTRGKIGFSAHIYGIQDCTTDKYCMSTALTRTSRRL